jgi:hypothetical protein
MRKSFFLALPSIVAVLFAPAGARAADVDARPPDRLMLTANGSTLTDSDDGGGGSLSWLHYVTPDALFGLGAEHQFIADSRWTFGSLRGSFGHGQPASRFNISGEVQYGEGDENDRQFDYAVGVLAISQAFTDKFSVQLEERYIDIDTSRGNLPKISLSYLWSPRVFSTVSYAQSFGGNLGTELTSARIDVFGQSMKLMFGGAVGTADPSVINLQPGLNTPARDLREVFAGIGRTFGRGEINLIGDYQEMEDIERVTVTLTFTAFLGSRGRAP